MMGYYDIGGKPITMEQYVLLGVDIDYKRVGLDVLSLDGVQVKVSTVWLGIDHNFSGEGAPLIFETMTFGAAEETCVRWPTRESAAVGHRLIVEAFETGRLDLLRRR